jgi:F-type H+-transporting ATPase subunit delta
LELLGLLIEKKRVMFVEEILEAYRYLYEKHKGIIEVKAITAVPLDEALSTKLRKTLEDQTKKTIRLTTEVEPEIIGGMILKLEDKVIDGSLRYELEQFKRHLIETSVVQAQLGTDNQE